MKTINGIMFKSMLQSGAYNLDNNHEHVDSLNVFPVPDGDTGTNMSMTFNNGVNSVVSSGSTDLKTIAKILSRGLLMGARGNSGVILSQIFRGFYQSLNDVEELCAKDFAVAFANGSTVAYKAVMRPVEGTILTVIRESSTKGLTFIEENPEADCLEFMEYLCQEAKISLDHTPELLPVLKEVGVVDSGGAGLLFVLEGFKAAMLNKPFEKDETVHHEEMAQTELESDEYGYCTEFIVRLNENGVNSFNEAKMRSALEKMGESIVVVHDEDLFKVHVHTLTPGDALNLAQRYGEFVKIKVENMQEQHNNIIAQETEKVPHKKYAIVSCCAGDGVKDLFLEYRVDKIIEGGQTMNPSTEDFVANIKSLKADHIIVLPNNSNIILAANQAKDILEDMDIHVLPTKSVPQGLAACIMFNPEVDIEENLEEMQEAIGNVKTGQITYAIKDTTFEGLTINSGDYMGIFDKAIVASCPDKMEATYKLLSTMIDDDSEIVTLIVGEDATEQEVKLVEEYLADNFADVEVEVQQGLQPVYSFVIGVE